jgi:hypothetical protein
LSWRLLDHKSDSAGALAGGTSQVESKQIRARAVGAGVAPEFMPKHNRVRIDIRGWRADDARRPEIGEMRNGPSAPCGDPDYFRRAYAEILAPAAVRATDQLACKP